MWILTERKLNANPEEVDAGGGLEPEAPEVEGTGGETAGEVDTSDSSSDPWGDMFDEIERGPQDPAAEPPPSPQADPEPVSEQPPEPTPEPTPEPEAPAEPQAQPEPQATQPQPEAEPVNWDQVRDEIAGQYAIPEADLQALRDDPEGALPQVLPKMLANVHVRVQQEMAEALKQAVPQMVASYNANQKRATQASEQFFERWPKLKEAVPTDQLAPLIRAYRTANPQASIKDVIENVGAMAMVRFKVPAEAPAPRTPPKPPTPAGGTAAPSMPTQPQAPANPYSEMFDEIMQHEEG